MKNIKIDIDEAVKCFITEHLGKLINANEGSVAYKDDGIHVKLIDGYDEKRLYGFDFKSV